MFHFYHDYDAQSTGEHQFTDVFLHSYAQALGTTVTPDGRLIFPEIYATGFIQLFTLSNGLTATVSDYRLNQDFFLQRKAAKASFYALRVHETTLASNLPLNDDGSDTKNLLAAVWLVSSLFEANYIASSGSSIRGVDIVFTTEWMATFLGIPNIDEVLLHYVSMKANGINFEPMDATYHELLHAIIEEEQHDQPFRKATIENRLMQLVERFFTNLYKRIDLQTTRQLPKVDEVKRIMEAEALLVKDFCQPAPTIPMLARYAAMSETKFKTLFKRIYGSGPYEYFQQNRMLRARYLLVVKMLSVKEVGMQLGYNNLSNFTIAYKKAFNSLPSESRN